MLLSLVSVLISVARLSSEFGKLTQGPRRGRGWGRGGTLGQLVHTFDFLYEHTHSRRRNAHKNVTFSNFLMNFQPFKRLKFHKCSGGSCPWNHDQFIWHSIALSDRELGMYPRGRVRIFPVSRKRTCNPALSFPNTTYFWWGMGWWSAWRYGSPGPHFTQGHGRRPEPASGHRRPADIKVSSDSS